MAALKSYHYYAGNEWHEPASRTWFDSFDPTEGEVWACIPRCNTEDVDYAVQTAHAAFEPWRTLLPSARGNMVRKLGDALVRNADRLGEIETRDNGKKTIDITPGLKGWLADSFYYYAGLCDKLEGSVIPVDTPGILNYTKQEPFGAVACITAWNSPLGVAIVKIAPALAAGNTVVIKPSEHASASTLAMMDAFEEAELPPGVLNVVTGFGDETGSSLISHPLIRLVSFTGGVTGGSAAAMAASGQVKPIIMELGGKSPQIVLADADLELAVNGIAAGIFPVSGQTCIAGSRLLVQREIHDEVVDRLCKVVSPARLGHPKHADTQIGPIANEPHFKRILENIDNAKSGGAKLILGGNAVQPESAPNGWFVEPTIFTGVTPDMPLAREEVFGPLLAVIPFGNEEDAIRLANDSKFGLAAGVWTRDSARGIRMAERISAGTVYINNYFNATTQSPVGGYKQSGYGRESGIEGMKAFLQTKSVWLATEPNQPNPFA